MTEHMIDNKPLSILLVDDDPLVLRAMARELRGYRLRTASSMERAAAALERDAVDVVMTDFDMPGGDGVALLELVRRTHPATRRVLMSGDPPSSLGALRLAGVVECFVAKPFRQPLAQLLEPLVRQPAAPRRRRTRERVPRVAASAPN